MAININDDQTEALVGKLAELTGETPAEVVRIAVAERLQRVHGARDLRDELNKIALQCASRPVISNMTDDEILGYDEFGIPTR